MTGLQRLRQSGFIAALFGASLSASCADTEPEAEPQAADTTAAEAEPSGPLTIADVGFQTPESVLHDEEADVYLVSNINGEPLGRDGNGFISRIRPDGEVEELRWIDGAAEGVTLHAPKGMAVVGDTLFVSDIDSVRAFNRSSGAPLGARGVPGATFLNDLAAGADGSLYVSDTGVDASFSPNGTAAVHRLGDGEPRAIARGDALGSPNGLAVADGDVLMVPFGDSAVFRIPAGGGEPDRLAELPAGQLDGLIRMADGSLLVSSWAASAVFRVGPDGAVSTVVEGVESPADIGYDARRGRVLIPLFTGNAIEVREVR